VRPDRVRVLRGAALDTPVARAYREDRTIVVPDVADVNEGTAIGGNDGIRIVVASSRSMPRIRPERSPMSPAARNARK
jgi:hypothetical protein